MLRLLSVAGDAGGADAMAPVVAALAASDDVTVQVVAGLPLIYNFDDATFQGWTDVSLGNTGTQGWSTTTGHGDVTKAPTPFARSITTARIRR